MGVTASCFGLGATLSNFFGQMVAEHFGHVVSLMGSLVLSIAPIIIFSFMPETYGLRGDESIAPSTPKKKDEGYNTFNV